MADWDLVKKLIQMVKEEDISGLAIEEKGVKYEVRREKGGPAPIPHTSHLIPLSSSPVPAKTDEDDGLIAITSPMVGTFYRSPSPEAPVFVQTGDEVEPGKVVCVIEAKNLFVFAGLIFSLKFFELPLLLTVIYAFIIFCALSSAIYLINDVRDAEGDRKHPVKKLRPIAAGKLSPTVAIVTAILLALISLIFSIYLSFSFFLVSLIYFLLMILYTFALRDMVILDTFSIAAGFILRAVAGVVVIAVELSPWLVICTILLSLFIALGKRRHELVTLGTGAHRKILDEYNPQLVA